METILTIVVGIAFCIFVITVVFGFIGMMLSDTETFMAIDEKIAKLIRGKKE